LSFLQENIQQKSGKASFEVHITANPEDGSHIPIASCNRVYFATLASRGLQEVLRKIEGSGLKPLPGVYSNLTV
jgi:hypothetical protein